MQEIQNIIQKSIEVKQQLLSDKHLMEVIQKVCEEMIQTFRGQKKVLFCGNGGSAADAQHIAAELSGRFYLDRSPLPAEALHVNTSFLTAVANDYSYGEVFSRMVTAQGKKGDMLVALSTSGNSENVVKAVLAAQKAEMIVVGLTGASGGKMKSLCQYLLNVPSNDTPRIQECHIMLGHIICEIVERTLFQKN